MAPSRTKLAETLDAIVAHGDVTVTEARESISVYQLTGTQALQVLDALDTGEWTAVEISDAGGELSKHQLTSASDGVIIRAERVPLPDGIEAVITQHAFTKLLSRREIAPVVWVHGLDRRVDTVTVRFCPWGDISAFESVHIASPEKVVRLLNGDRDAGLEIGRYTLRPPVHYIPCPAMTAWEKRATHVLLSSLAQEVEPDNKLLFRGPPPSRFEAVQSHNEPNERFVALQQTVNWVFETEKELENRHALLAAEIARVSLRNGNLSDLLAIIDTALEGARIAYNFGVTQQNKDTLKSLADLRKSITDDTAKLSEVTRSMATAVVGAIFGNMGLILARLTLQPTSKYIGVSSIILGIVLLLYVIVTAYSGFHHIGIQRHLRKEWREKVYRFLTNDDYEKMVGVPVKKAENLFHRTSLAAIIMAALCFAALFLIARGSSVARDDSCEKGKPSCATSTTSPPTTKQ